MADVTTVAPATYSQPSRKGKKAWRKNVDLTEVTTGLDTVRDEIIKGGILSEKAADELFATDITGDSDVAKKQLSKKLLKADEILAQRSAVPGLEPGRKRKAEAVVPKESKRYKKGEYVSHKELQRLRSVADNAAGVQVDEKVEHDPWTETNVVKDPRLTFLEEKREKKEPKTLKERPIPLTAAGKPIPSVRKPSAGKSYNPLVTDWTALLEREGQAAVDAEKARLAAEAEAAEKERIAEEEAAKVEAAERDEYGTDYESAWESEWEGFNSEAEKESFAVKQRARKTPTERNKIKARKERERREVMERKEKARREQERRIAQLAKEASARDKLRRPGTLPSSQLNTQDSSASDSDADEPALQRRRFGKLAIPDAPLEVVLPDELQDSLRRLKPEGNLLTDRYRNLLVNGKVEVRKKQWQYRQAKTDRTEKWSYKDWKLR